MQAFIKATEIQNPIGLWLIHGDEPLIASWIMDAWRKNWIKNQVERKRYDTKSPKTWVEALSEFQAMGLFSSQTVVELHGNHKPDKNGLQQLKAFCEQPDENCFIIMMPTQDWRAKKTAFYKTCEQMGTVFDTSLTNNNDRQSLLAIKAKEFSLELQQDAWQLLLQHTQNNLLGAYQALWRMSDLAVINHNDLLSENGMLSVNADMLTPALVSQSKFNQFDLTNHVLQGNISQVIEVIHYLKESGESPGSVLWNLSKEAKIITQLANGSKVTLPGWQLKKYNQAIARTNPHICKTWTNSLLEIDKSIKGLSIIPVWELLLDLSLSMAGKPVLNHSNF